MSETLFGFGLLQHALVQILKVQETFIDGSQQNLFLVRFLHEIDCPLFHRLHCDRHVAMSSQNDDRHLAPALIEGLLNGEPVHFRHLYIEKNAAALEGVEMIEKAHAIRMGLDAIS